MSMRIAAVVVTMLVVAQANVCRWYPGSCKMQACSVSIVLDSLPITSIDASWWSPSYASIITSVTITNNPSLTSISGSAFSSLSNLVTLDLHGNALQSLPSTSFSGLTLLTSLMIQGNYATSLPQAIFSPLTSTVSITLDPMSSGTNGQPTAHLQCLPKKPSKATYLSTSKPAPNFASMPLCPIGGITTSKSRSRRPVSTRKPTTLTGKRVTKQATAVKRTSTKRSTRVTKQATAVKRTSTKRSARSSSRARLGVGVTRSRSNRRVTTRMPSTRSKPPAKRTTTTPGKKATTVVAKRVTVLKRASTKPVGGHTSSKVPPVGPHPPTALATSVKTPAPTSIGSTDTRPAPQISSSKSHQQVPPVTHARTIRRTIVQPPPSQRQTSHPGIGGTKTDATTTLSATPPALVAVGAGIVVVSVIVAVIACLRLRYVAEGHRRRKNMTMFADNMDGRQNPAATSEPTHPSPIHDASPEAMQDPDTYRHSSVMYAIPDAFKVPQFFRPAK